MYLGRGIKKWVKFMLDFKENSYFLHSGVGGVFLEREKMPKNNLHLIFEKFYVLTVA